MAAPRGVVAPRGAGVAPSEGVLAHSSFTQMVLNIDPHRTTREIDVYFLEVLATSDSNGREGGELPMVTDVIQCDAWVQIANLHGLRPSGSSQKPRLRSPEAARRSPEAARRRPGGQAV